VVEFRWFGRSLQFRQRSFQVDASGALCGLTEFGPWETVEQRKEMPPFVKAAREIVAQYEQHGIGPEFPELQQAIEGMQEAFEKSMWSR